MQTSETLFAILTRGAFTPVLYALAVVSKQAACSFANAWNKYHTFYPNWVGHCHCPILCRTVAGMLACDPKDSLQQVLIRDGQWEPTVTAAVQALLEPGDVFIDIGANIGYFSLLASQIVGKDGIVVAVEPLPENLEELIANRRRNRIENIVMLSVAFSNKPALVDLYLGPADNIGKTSTRPIGDMRVSVASCPGASVLQPELFKRTKLIKIDVEGAESLVLSGLRPILEQDNPPYVICEITDNYLRQLGSSGDDLLQSMRELRYDIYLTSAQRKGGWLKFDGGQCPEEQMDALFVPLGGALPNRLTYATKTEC